MATGHQEQLSAASEFADASAHLLADQPFPKSETVIAATARMAGTFLFRSFAFDLKNVTPGTAVLSEQANESGPQLVGLLSGVLAHLGITIDDAPVELQAIRNSPRLDFLSSQRVLEPAFIRIQQRFALSAEEAAQAAAFATAVLIKQAEDELPPASAFGIAVYGFIEGTKTAPDPVTLSLDSPIPEEGPPDGGAQAAMAKNIGLK